MADTSEHADHAIARAIRAGRHRRALELLASHYGARLGRLAFALSGHQQDAEELVQEILLEVYRAMPGFAGRSRVRTWVYTIARRTCGRARQKRQRRRRILAAVDLGQPELPTPLERAELSLQSGRLCRAMAELSEAQREVLLLRHVSGLSYREVAEVCGIQPDAARQRASAGLRRLRELMTEPAAGRPAAVVAACQELS